MLNALNRDLNEKTKVVKYSYDGKEIKTNDKAK